MVFGVHWQYIFTHTMNSSLYTRHTCALPLGVVRAAARRGQTGVIGASGVLWEAKQGQQKHCLPLNSSVHIDHTAVLSGRAKYLKRQLTIIDTD